MHLLELVGELARNVRHRRGLPATSACSYPATPAISAAEASRSRVNVPVIFPGDQSVEPSPGHTPVDLYDVFRT